MTPEGKVKAAVSRVLKKHGAYYFMYVPYGYGKSTVDYLVCAYGTFVAIETKAPGKLPTARQRLTLEEIDKAGGLTFVIDGPDGVRDLENYLDYKRTGVSQA